MSKINKPARVTKKWKSLKDKIMDFLANRLFIEVSRLFVSSSRLILICTNYLSFAQITEMGFYNMSPLIYVHINYDTFL
jgi:hypothetical protein